MRRIFLFLLLLLPFLANAQTAVLSGVVRDDENRPFPDVSVAVLGGSATSTGANGSYSLTVPAGMPITVRFAYAGSENVERNMELKAGEARTLDVIVRYTTINTVTVTNERLRDAGIDKLNARTSHFLPSLRDVNSLVQGSLGVMTRNQLSSGYNVPGGNFDENLV